MNMITNKEQALVNIIVKVVASHWDVSEKGMLGRVRTYQTSLARKVAMTLCRDYAKISSANVALIFDRRDPSTVSAAACDIHGKSRQDFGLFNDLEAILQKIKTETKKDEQ